MPNRQPFKGGPRDERAHPLIENYLDIHGINSGVYAPLAMPGAKDRQRGVYDNPVAAINDRRSMYRGAKHFRLSAHVIVGDGPDEGTGILTFALFDKDVGRRHVFQQSGGDPARLAYNPYSKGNLRRRS